MVTVALITLWLFLGGTEATYNETKVTGLDLFSMGRKDVELLDCKPRMRVAAHMIAPKPTCRFIDTEHITTPLMVSFYEPVDSEKMIEATLCRKMIYSKTFYSNFLGFEKVTNEHKKWAVANRGVCDLLKTKTPETDSMIAEAKQYGKLDDQFKWFSTQTVTKEIYFIVTQQLNVQQTLGSITTLDNHELNCKYLEGQCQLHQGGLLTWEVMSDIVDTMNCPYRITHNEICIGQRVISDIIPYIQITCPQSKTQHYVDGTRGNTGPCDVRLFETVAGNVISLNATNSDIAELIDRQVNMETLNMYSLRRLKCDHRSGEEKCSLNAHVKKTDCRAKLGCTKLSEMTSAYCHGGLCVMEKGLSCVKEGKTISKALPYQDNVDVYLPKDIKPPYCIEIRRDGYIIYNNGLTRKVEGPEPFHTLITEKQEILDGHTIKGFTVKKGKRCLRKGSEMITITNVSTYTEAITRLMAENNDYREYIMCQATSLNIIFTKQSIKGEENDFIFEYSGSVQTKDLSPFLESQLNYIGALVTKEKEDTLQVTLQQHCSTLTREWVVGRALLTLDPNLYIQLYANHERAGKMEQDRLVSWKCDKVNEWQLTENPTGKNCTKNTAISFKNGNIATTGFLNRYTKRISNNSGGKLPCIEKQFVMFVGNAMFIRYSHNETYLMSEEILLKPTQPFIEAKPMYTMHQESGALLDRVESLELQRLEDGEIGYYMNGETTYVNSTTGLTGILSVKGFSLRNILKAEETIGTIIMCVTVVVVFLILNGPIGKICCGMVKSGWSWGSRQVGTIRDMLYPKDEVNRVHEGSRTRSPVVRFTNVTEDDVHSD